MSLARSLIFALVFLFAQSAGASIIMGPMAPAGPVVLWAMDFEGSGCIDTDSGSTCSSTGGTLDMDCTTGAAPLEGSLSACVGSDGFIYVAAKFDAGTNDVTLDLLVNWDVHSSLGSNKQMFQLWGDGAFRCSVIGRPDNVNIWAYTGQSGAGISITEDTTYRLRLEWNRSTKLCKIFLDTTGTDWGVGAVGTSEATNISWTPGAITEFRVLEADTVRIIRIVDDIGICEGISLGTTKCGD
jgi:hypothetical protein